MTLKELEREDMVRKFPVYRKRVGNSLNLARRDLKIARQMFEESYDWAFSIAYNSILQSARALMFSKGYRPSGNKQHLSVIKFIEAVLGDKYKKEVTAFDRLRRKRHAAIYDEVGVISEYEAKFAIESAERFLGEIEGIVEEASK
jgi:uncharacterized protein (UPF0332 family)